MIGSHDWKRILILSACLLILGDHVYAQAPTVTAISPTSGPVGVSVTITGTGFGSTQGTSTVALNGTSAVVISWSGTSVAVIVPTGATTGTFSVTVNSQSAQSATFTVTALPSSWTDADIGTVGVAGSASYANGTFTVKGAGGGTLSTNADGVNFLYQSLSGDGTVIARVVSTSGSGSQEAGVMIRETLNSGATNAQSFYYAGSGGFNLTERTSTGATSDGYISAQGVSVSPPYWVKLVRSGNTFSGYTSFDGESWLQVGSSETITMATNVYVGLYVTNRSTSALATGTFDSVSINSTANPGPVITSLSATTVSTGSQLLINGTGFGSSQNGGQVTLNGLQMTVDNWISTGIIITVPSGATTGPLLVSVAPSMNDSNAVILEITSQPLLNPWVNEDIGAVGVLGSATYANSTFTVKGAGGGTLVATADGIQFLYQPLSGDGTIVARVASTSGGGSQEAGVMIRETLDPGSKNVQTLYYAGGAGGGGFNLTERTTTSATSDGYVSAQAITGAPPYWVKLVRSSNTFSGYASLDGVNWTQIGSSESITMATNVYVGLYVSNRSTTSLATATFDGVSLSTPSSAAPSITGVSETTGSVGSQIVISGSGFGSTQNGSVVTLNDALVTINSWGSTSIVVTIPTGATSGPLMVSLTPTMNNSNPVEFEVTTNPLPTAWLDQDVGATGIAGSATYSSGVFTVTGAGAQIYGTSDAFHFVYVPLSGDGTIIARIASLSGPAGYIAAGAMIRNTLDAASMNIKAADWLSYNGIYLDVRSSNGGSTSEPGSKSASLPYWVKLIRSGSTFYGYTSPDGSTWTQVGSNQTISMATNVNVGLAVTSGRTTSSATATFDNVSVMVGSTPFVTGISPSLGGVGTSVTIAGSNFGASQGTSTVAFNGTQATTITSWSNTQIVATVPSGATTGLVTVTVNSVQSPSTSTFTVINPVITSLTPPAAQPVSFITITGTGFGGSETSSDVKFNGVSANVSSWSDTSITAVVPSNATSGPVTVIRDGVTSAGVSFTVLEALTVAGLSTSAGKAGSSLTITGTGFGPTQSNSLVMFFSGAIATVSSWSDTQIVVTVPAALSGPVGVEVAGKFAFGPSFTMESIVQLTDSLSNQSTYTSALIAGRWVPLSVQGSGCSTCSVRGTISYTYDANGNPLTRTDENGHATTYTYDSNNNVLTVTVPINSTTSATTTYTYNSFNEVLTATDPLGNVTTNTYDAKGNLLTVTTPAPNGNTAASVTTFTYDTKGELLTIKDPLNNVTSLTYTSTGLINTVTDAQNNVTTYGYDTHGNRTSVTDALNHQTTFTYDSMDRLTKITYPDTTTTQFAYDSRGRRTSVTDQNGKVTSYSYDDADRLITVTDAATNVTTYGYDTENNLTSIKDANSNTTSFSYDAWGRVTKTTFPSSLTETYSYDAIGNLTGKTDRKGQYISYTYDQLNRLTQKTYPDTTTVNYTYDNDSRLTQVVDPTGTYSFTFDNMGRLTGTTTSYSFLTSRTFTTAFSYDAASNRTGFTDPESGSSTYAYDTLNRLQTLTPPSAISSGNFGFGYDALSRRTSLTRPNSVNTTYSYDNLSRLLSVLHKNGSTTLDGASYTVDNAGNRTAKTDQYANVTSNYTYDSIYELTQVTQAANTTESYSYDPVGNRLSSLGVSSYTNNSSNELTSTSNATYTYDYNGNTLTKVMGSNTTSFAWDYENRLTSVTLPGSGGTVSFKYDSFGRRVYKSSSATTSIYAYDGNDLVEEANGAGTVVARYSRSENIDEPFAVLRSGGTNFYETDGLWSTTSLTSTAGAIVQTYEFDSFGNLVTSSGSVVNPFQYSGREFDPETGLYYYRARYYDPKSGRFLSEDPMGFEAGENFYAYVENDPADWGDADGTEPQRRVTGRPDGTPNPFKKLTPDPDDPTKVIYKNPDTGKSVKKAKPPGFDDYWKKKHPQQNPKPQECPSQKPAPTPAPKPDPNKFDQLAVPNPHCIPGLGCYLGEDGYYHKGLGPFGVPPLLPTPGVPVPSPTLPTIPIRLPPILIPEPILAW